MDTVAGMNFHAYANTGTYSSPTWVLVGNVSDLDLGDTINLYVTKLRKNAPFDSTTPTIRSWNPKFKLAWIEGDTLMEALIAASNGQTAIDMQFLSGSSVPANTVTVEGPRATWNVESQPRSEHMDEAGMMDISLKIAETGYAPAWQSITGS